MRAAAETRRFARSLCAEVMRDVRGGVAPRRVERRNELRFGRRPVSGRLRALRGRLRRAGGGVATARSTIRDLGRYAHGWTLYADDRSRRVYLRLLAHRILGPRWAPLPLDAAAYWAAYDRACREQPADAARHGGGGFDVPTYDLRPFGFDVTARIRAGGLLAYCLLGQYELHRPGVDIAVEDGDVVIDGGAAWGDTALLFAERAGASGHVVSVDPSEDGRAVFEENMALNPALATRIELVESALLDVSGRRLAIERRGPASRVVEADPGGSLVESITIDDLADARGLPRVDFVKLDVEGSELAVLRGAARTLAAFRPKLAISAYHRPRDIADLAAYLRSLGLGYRLYLEHFTDHTEETVLFAIPGRTGGPPEARRRRRD